MPSVMRVAPAPLYNSFADVFTFVCTLREVFDSLEGKLSYDTTAATAAATGANRVIMVDGIPINKSTLPRPVTIAPSAGVVKLTGAAPVADKPCASRSSGSTSEEDESCSSDKDASGSSAASSSSVTMPSPSPSESDSELF